MTTTKIIVILTNGDNKHTRNALFNEKEKEEGKQNGKRTIITRSLFKRITS